MILNKTIAPIDGEVSIKGYLCTSFSSFFFGIKANGYLEVTNKRLLFQAVGTGATRHSSVIHSEVPISEVVGINIYKGKAFNLFRLLGGLLIGLLTAVVSGFISTYLLSTFRNSPVFYQFIVWAFFPGAIFLAYFYKNGTIGMQSQTETDSTDDSMKELLIAYLGVGFLVPLGQTSMGYYNQFGTAGLALGLAILSQLYILYRFSRRPAFSLHVHSKSASNAIVRITGPSPMGMANSAAAKALTAKPGKDSMLVLKELGALITDVQNMGEYGVGKWKAA